MLYKTGSMVKRRQNIAKMLRDLNIENFKLSVHEPSYTRRSQADAIYYYEINGLSEDEELMVTLVFDKDELCS